MLFRIFTSTPSIEAIKSVFAGRGQPFIGYPKSSSCIDWPNIQQRDPYLSCALDLINLTIITDKLWPDNPELSWMFQGGILYRNRMASAGEILWATSYSPCFLMFGHCSNLTTDDTMGLTFGNGNINAHTIYKDNRLISNTHELAAEIAHKKADLNKKH